MEDLGACSYLAWCGSLHHLTLAGNPVAEEENYHSEVGSSWSKQAASALPEVAPLWTSCKRGLALRAGLPIATPEVYKTAIAVA